MLSTKQVRREFGTFAGALRPDGKAQVTIEYETKQHGSLQPVRVHAIVMSVQHGPDITTDRLRSEVIAHVIKPAIPANLLDDKTQLLVNPAGRFVIGGPHGDAGASGRQIVADAGGPWTGHGGSAATGKTGAKVERCGAYAARWAAKSLVEAGFASRCAVQLAYTSGKQSRLSVWNPSGPHGLACLTRSWLTFFSNTSTSSQELWCSNFN